MVFALEGVELVFNVCQSSILTFVFVVRKCVEWGSLLLRVRVMEIARSEGDACFDVCKDVIRNIHRYTEDVEMDVSPQT